MKYEVKTLDGNPAFFNLNGKKQGEISGLHTRALALISALFPSYSIYEEIVVPIYSRKNLMFDIFIPTLGIFFEVQGEQHEKFNSFHHKSMTHFLKAQKNDQDKSDWCIKNNYMLVCLNFNETDKEWEKKIESIIENS